MKAILYDGWSLVYQPNSAPALHLLALLAYHPAEIPGVVALPGEIAIPLPSSIQAHVRATANTHSSRLGWQQRTLNQAAHQVGAGLVHLTAQTPALLGDIPVVISPSAYPEEAGANQPGAKPGFWERLERSLALGGMARKPYIFWPEGLPASFQAGMAAEVIQLPPFVYPGFFGDENNGETYHQNIPLPDGGLLYHGPQNQAALERVVRAWDWAARPLGGNFQLVVLGMDENGRARLEKLVREYALEETVQVLPIVPPEIIPLIYRQCQAVFHPSSIPAWGGAVRQAIANGTAVVAAEDPMTDALVGEAAYLAPASDPRTLGAALITVAVEESVAGNLAHASTRRAAGWNNALTIKQRLLETYQALLEKA